MHSIESYLRRQSTERLQLILAYGSEYPVDTVLLVQQILAERSPFPGDWDDIELDDIKKEDL